MNIFFPQTSRGEKHVGIIVLIRVFSNKVEEQRARKWGGKVARFGLFEWKINVGEKIGVEEEEVLLQSEANLIWNRISDQIRWLGFSFFGVGVGIISHSISSYIRSRVFTRNNAGDYKSKTRLHRYICKKKFFSAEISAHKSIFLSLSLEKRKWEMGRKREKQSKFSNYSDVFPDKWARKLLWSGLNYVCWFLEIVSSAKHLTKNCDEQALVSVSESVFVTYLEYEETAWDIAMFSIRTKRKHCFFNRKCQW